MCFVCRITRATNTHPEYLIIIAFPCQDTIVGVAACHRLDGPGIKFQKEQDFLHTSRLPLAPTHPAIQWILGLFSRGKAAGAWH